MTTFGLVLAGVGLVIAVFGLLKLLKANKIAAYESRHALVTHALSVKKNKRKFIVPMLQLTVDGKMYAGEAKKINGNRSYRDNQQVLVKWSAEHPKDLYIEGDCTIRSGAITLLIIAAACVVLGAGVAIFG